MAAVANCAFEATASNSLSPSRAGQPTRAFFLLPTELKEKIVGEITCARDLACLGQTCRFMSDFIEDLCYLAVTIYSPAGLASLCESLLNSRTARFGDTRSQRLRSLSIAWLTMTFSLPRVHDDVDRILLRAPNIAHLRIDIPMSDRHPIASPLQVSMTDKISLRHA